MSRKIRSCTLTFFFCHCFLAFVSAELRAEDSQGSRFTSSLLEVLEYRNLGPFRAGAWVSDIAVPESPPRDHLYTLYVASRTGGLWKTANNGTTFEPLFDEQTVLSIGAVSVAPSNPEIVWVGTGGAENARSTYWGDGVYKSTDGGETWRNMGLGDSHHIARIVVHPSDPDTVYIAAMGHLFTPNEQRGVFRTTDGGETWEQILYINENVGIIDLVMSRKEPDTLFAAAYEKYRYPWHFEEGGPESGIYKSTDGGRSWGRLTGGLPTGKIGRIGLDIFQRRPDIVYAVVENANKRPPTEEEAEREREAGVEPQDRIIGGEVYRSDDAGRTWQKMNRIEDNVGGKAAYSFNQIRIDPLDDKKIYVTSIAIANSTDGGRTWHDINWPPKNIFPNFFGDVRALWIDPEDGRRIIAGTDGGIHISYDGGKTSDFLHNLPLGEVYGVGVDMEEPYNIYAGLQDHESWRGPSNSWSGEVGIEDWVTVGTSDGMVNVVDPDDSRWLYNTYQFGGHHRVDQKTRARKRIMPERPEGEEPYRFTWTTPLIISPHNSQIVYTGAEVLLRSLDRGDTWHEVSPDLTTNDAEKIAGRGHIQYCAITSISESPVTPGLVWVGTDDGKVWLTRNGGASWKDATDALVSAGAPRDVWVSRVHASPHDEAMAFVTKTGRHRDDFRPFVYKTTDWGETWIDLSGKNDGRLPDFPVNVIVHDRKSPDLLFLGNDRGVFVTIDGGQNWVHFKANMPNVPVHDLVVHPRENDLVVGTYGRSIWITDVSPLQQMSEAILEKPVHFFEIEPRTRFQTSGWGNYKLYGDRQIVTPNDAEGLVFNYYLRDEPDKMSEEKKGPARFTIEGPFDTVVRNIVTPGAKGLNRTIWDLRDEENEPVAPGDYLVTLEVAGEKHIQRARIK